MNFRGGDRGGRAAVQITLEIANHALPRGIIAKGNMHMAVDQPGDGRSVGGIDHHVTGRDRTGGEGPDLGDEAVPHQDAVALGEWACEVAGHDGADIDDCRAHGRLSWLRTYRRPSLPTIASAARPPTRALRRPRLARKTTSATSSAAGASGGSVTDTPS